MMLAGCYHRTRRRHHRQCVRPSASGWQSPTNADESCTVMRRLYRRPVAETFLTNDKSLSLAENIPNVSPVAH